MPEKVKAADLKPLNYDYLQDRYRQRAKELASKSQGLERLCYSVFGYKLMGSIAFALDPWARFAFPTVTTTKVNRVRVIPGIASDTRAIRVTSKTLTDRTFYYPSASHTIDEATTVNTTVLTPQIQIDGFIKDTTVRTRGKDSPVGEYEMFVPRINSSGFSYTYKPNRTTSSVPGVSFVISDQDLTTERMGSAFRVLKTDVTADAAAAKGRANAAIVKQALGLVSKALPTSRKYNLFYQLAELKDIPRLIKDLCTSIRLWGELYSLIGSANFALLIRGRPISSSYIDSLKTIAARLGLKHDFDKNVSSLYLSFKFGWESLLSSVNGITSKPAIVAKAMNRLLLRNGTASNFRSGFSWIEKSASPVAFAFETTGSESKVDGTNSLVRKCQLRCVVNATFNFPQVDVPTFRSMYFRKLGLDVSPLDLINLVPWTWLADWFIGYSSYLQMMDALWNDKSLINYGFITYREDNECSLAVKLARSYTSGDWVSGQGWINSKTSSLVMYPSASYKSKYQYRLALSSVAGIVTPTSLGLSDYQKSILSALIAKFSGSSRK